MHTTVFVYGTLKRGFPNHNWLATATFIAPAWTEASEFRMGNVGAYPEVTRVDHHSPDAAARKNLFNNSSPHGSIYGY